MTQSINKFAQLVAAVGEENRLRIFRFLLDGAKHVGAIAKCINTNSSNTSHHVRTMLSVKLVTSEKRSRQVFYSLNPEFVDVATCSISCDGFTLRLEFPKDNEEANP